MEAQPPSSANDAGIPASILLVDDQAANLLALQAILEPLGERLVLAPSGEKALRLLAEEEFAVVLLDVQMPNFDGFETAKLLRGRKHSRHTPIIFVTAFEADQFPVVEAYKLGAVDYLVKPLVPEILRAKAAVFVELFRNTKLVLRQLNELRALDQRHKANERRLRLVIDSAFDAFIVIDSAGRIVEWNPQAVATFGWSRQEALDRVLVTTIIPPAYREAHLHGLERFRATGAGPVLNQRLQLSALHLDGHEFPVELTISAIPWEGNFLFAAFVHDISERRRAEERIRERTAQLEGANKELDSFCYAVAHDLRAPLRAIDGFSQALLEDYADSIDAQAQDYCRRVRNAAQRMGQLIDALLKLSRVKPDELRRETVDLSGMAAAIAAELQQKEPERRVTFAISSGVVAQGDGPLLRIVLENLLSNAWKFTCKHPQVCIEFGATYREGRVAYFVRDDGAGFDMTYAGKLFGPFQRLHSEAEFPGLGIGLATVQRIIHLHGGASWAEGAVERGATFYFTLASAGATTHE